MDPRTWKREHQLALAISAAVDGAVIKPLKWIVLSAIGGLMGSSVVYAQRLMKA